MDLETRAAVTQAVVPIADSNDCLPVVSAYHALTSNSCCEVC